MKGEIIKLIKEQESDELKTKINKDSLVRDVLSVDMDEIITYSKIDEIVPETPQNDPIEGVLDDDSDITLETIDKPIVGEPKLTFFDKLINIFK